MSRDNPVLGASVLLTFRAENARSFPGELELSMLATSIAEEPVVQWVSWREGGRPLGVLPVAAVFGANASGKTNVLKALNDMREHVQYSFRAGNPAGKIVRQPFRLDPAFQHSPSRYEVDLVLNGVRHEYGFVINDARVIEEWALRYPHGKAATIFRRTEDGIRLGSSAGSKGRAVVELLRPNALFLSTAASARHPELFPLYEWFDQNLDLADVSTRSSRQMATADLLEDEGNHERVLALLRAADLGIVGVRRRTPSAAMKERMRRVIKAIMDPEEAEEQNDEEILKTLEGADIRLIHQGDRGRAAVPLRAESHGTLVWFGLIGTIVESLMQGSIILVDELDASLHPSLVAQLIKLFQDPETNSRQAQLIFNSHDITVLGESEEGRLLGRDQVWFTEKAASGATRLYPLSDFDPRKHEAVGKRYLAGRYGAVPILAPQEFAATVEKTIQSDGESN